MRKHLSTGLWILVGSILYAIGTNFFIFPSGLFLGGTSGISVIISAFTSLSSGTVLMLINFSLLVLALLILGKTMAVKTLIGSTLTTLFVGLFERIMPSSHPVIDNVFISGLAGALIVAIASGCLFYVDASSGGTDIAALIIKKYSNMNVGRALLVSDVLIVILGGLLLDFPTAIASFVGLLVKTIGIDLVIAFINRICKR